MSKFIPFFPQSIRPEDIICVVRRSARPCVPPSSPLQRIRFILVTVIDLVQYIHSDDYTVLRFVSKDPLILRKFMKTLADRYFGSNLGWSFAQLLTLEWACIQMVTGPLYSMSTILWYFYPVIHFMKALITGVCGPPSWPLHSTQYSVLLVHIYYSHWPYRKIDPVDYGDA